MTLQIPVFNTKIDKAMSPEQFNQVVEAILSGKYSWACVLILRFAGYNPLHYVPYSTYNRLLKENYQNNRANKNQNKNIKNQENQSIVNYPTVQNSLDNIFHTYSKEIQHEQQIQTDRQELYSDRKPCPRCSSIQTTKNGYRRGKQNYLCQGCGRQFIEFYSLQRYSSETKKLCLQMYLNNASFREIERVTGVDHTTVMYWIKQTTYNTFFTRELD